MLPLLRLNLMISISSKILCQEVRENEGQKSGHSEQKRRPFTLKRHWISKFAHLWSNEGVKGVCFMSRQTEILVVFTHLEQRSLWAFNKGTLVPRDAQHCVLDFTPEIQCLKKTAFQLRNLFLNYLSTERTTAVWTIVNDFQIAQIHSFFMTKK